MYLYTELLVTGMYFVHNLVIHVASKTEVDLYRYLGMH